MKSKKPLIAVAAIALVIMAVFIIRLVQQSAVEREIRDSLPGVVDPYIDKLLAKADNPNSFSCAYETGLTDISYTIKSVKYKDDSYRVQVEIFCTCNEGLSDVTYSLLAYEAENCFPNFEVDGHEVVYYAPLMSDYSLQNMFFTYVNGELIHQPKKVQKEKEDKNTLECSSCGKKFNKGSDNANSIRRTSMCANCYKNFQWAQDARDAINNLPVN